MFKAKDVDWEKIKNEYITDKKASYRSLSAKYGVAASAINERGKKGGWKTLREQYADKTQAKTLEALARVRAKGEVKRLEKLYEATDELTDKIADGIKKVRPTNTLAIRQLASALREVRLMEADLDTEEKRARISKIRESMVKPSGEIGGGVLILPEINVDLKPPEDDEEIVADG